MGYFLELHCQDCGAKAYCQVSDYDTDCPQCEECRSFHITVKSSDMVPCNQCGTPVPEPASDVVPNCDDCIMARGFDGRF